MCLMKLHNFSNVEEALNLLEKDPISKLYNHYFFESKKNFISQESKSDNFIININNNTKKENKKEIKDRCRIYFKFFFSINVCTFIFIILIFFIFFSF